MVGDGENRKSMAYVENVAAFLEYAIAFKPGVHIYNFVDKPDFTMNMLVKTVNMILGKSEEIGFRLPFTVGYLIGRCFDFAAAITGMKFAIKLVQFASRNFAPTQSTTRQSIEPASYDQSPSWKLWNEPFDMSSSSRMSRKACSIPSRGNKETMPECLGPTPLQQLHGKPGH
jgi:hypothetical protein